MKYFYLNEEHLQKGYPGVLEISDKAIENYEVEFLKKGIVARVYIGEYLPDRLVWDSNLKEVRIATEQERYDLDPANYELRENSHYMKDGIIKNKPQYPTNMLKPIFSVDLEIWEEAATQVELENHANAIYKNFYNEELEKFSKTTNEYNAGVITEAEYEECRAYIRALATQLDSNIKKGIERPMIMNRY